MTKKQEFIRFMVDCGVLKFGDFTLKSGRKAPYFLNAGQYTSGTALMTLGKFYAACIMENHIPVDTLFGPAYKGIPLATAAAIAMAQQYGKDVSFCFDRKEQKDHGEGGLFVGKQLEDGEKVVIIEDVMTSGKALGEVYPKLKHEANVEITGMVITVDRKERALHGTQSAAEMAYEQYGVRVYSIVTIDDIIEAIRAGEIPGQEHLNAILRYRAEYGV